MTRLGPAARLVLVLVAIVIVVVVVGVLASQRVAPAVAPSASPSSVTSPAASIPPSSTPDAGEPLSALLARLRVEPERRGGYDRDLFPLWVDDDGDGCDTRDEVLLSEAEEPPSSGSRCRLTGGRWTSAYDGLVVTDIAELSIDHVVALAEAWRSGARDWSTSRRVRFANDLDDPRALIAVSVASNMAKADSDPGQWLPSVVSARCPFVEAWIAVKVRWALSVDPAEHDDLASLAAGCPNAGIPVVVAP